jgi:cell division protein FtsW
MKLFGRRTVGRDSQQPRNTRPGKPGPASPASARPAAAVERNRADAGRKAAPAWPEVTGPADALLMGTVIALVAFGVVMVYSSSAVFAFQKYGSGQHFLIRQAIFAAAGLPLIVALARIDYHRLRVLTYPFLLGSLLLVFVTATVLGKSGGGATRWIALGPVNIQPSEFAKLALVMWLAYSLAKKSERIKTFTIGFLPHLLMASLLMLLCLRQPDFGSAVMIGVITFVLLFTAGAKLGYILGASMLAAPVVFWLIAGSEYRMRRITAFLEPFEHRFDVGYQVAESLISFGAGGVSGVGLGDSRQKLFFLPEAHTDFITAIVGEELGFIGIAILLAVFMLIIFRGLWIAFRAADDYGALLAVGITLTIGVQALTNLGVALGLLPTKGLGLPFVSYGGSALIANCVAMGILLNISRPRVPVSTGDGATANLKRADSAARALAGGGA